MQHLLHRSKMKPQSLSSALACCYDFGHLKHLLCFLATLNVPRQCSLAQNLILLLEGVAKRGLREIMRISVMRNVVNHCQIVFPRSRWGNEQSEMPLWIISLTLFSLLVAETQKCFPHSVQLLLFHELLPSCPLCLHISTMHMWQ